MSDSINLPALICAVTFMILKLLVRWVWYRPEHLRPGFLRHFFVIRALDFIAVLFFSATFFWMVNTGDWVRTLLIVLGLAAYDLLWRQFFLTVEARRLCHHSKQHHMDMKHAKHRLRRRAKQESPF